MNDLNNVVENIKRGDTNGWSVVYQTYYNRLYRHALSLTNNDPQNAQDAVQGAFARAMSDNRIQTLKDNDKLFQWLSTFVLNEVRPMWRKQEKFMAFSTAENYENTIDTIADDDICIPEDYAMDEAFKRRMKKAIESLSNQQRIVVQMYYYEGKTIPQIAAAMRLSESSVKTHLTAARAKLKKYIENYEKNGNKFRVIVPIPFVFNKEMPKGIYTAGLKTAGTVMATKVLAGVLAGLVVANVAVGTVMAVRNNNVLKNEDSDNNQIVSVDGEGNLEASKKGTDYVDYSDGYYSFTIPREYAEYIPEPLEEYELFLNEKMILSFPERSDYSIYFRRYKDDNMLLFEGVDFSDKRFEPINIHNDNLTVYITNSDYRPSNGFYIDIITSNNILVEIFKFTEDKSSGLEKEDEWLLDFAESIDYDESRSDEVKESFESLFLESLYKQEYAPNDNWNDNDPVSYKEMIEKYFGNEPNITLNYDGLSNFNILVSGEHDGTSSEISFSSPYHLQVCATTAGGVIKRYCDFNFDNLSGTWSPKIDNLSNKNTVTSKQGYQPNVSDDMYYWYKGDYYYLYPELSPNSVKYDTTPLDDFDPDKNNIHNRNFEYYTTVSSNNNRDIAFTSPFEDITISASIKGLQELHDYKNNPDFISVHEKNYPGYHSKTLYGFWDWMEDTKAIVKMKMPHADSIYAYDNMAIVYDVTLNEIEE